MTTEAQEFKISPKLPHSTIIKLNIAHDETRKVISSDIIQNARELAPTAKIDDVLPLFMAMHYRNGTVYNWRAIAATGAGGIGQTARERRWSMHTPEVVYMSGSHVIWQIDQSQALLNDELAQIRDGTRTFKLEEAKFERISRNAALTATLTDTKTVLAEALASYVEQGYIKPYSEEYLYILKTLPTPKGISWHNLKKKVFTALERGDISRAYNIIKQAGD